QSDGNNWVALSKGDGSFNFIHQPQGLTALFWGNENNSEQLIGDFNGDSSSDIVNLQSDGNNWLTLSNIKKNTEEKAINNLQSLRLETSYLTLQAQQNPDKVQNYLQTYNALKVLGTTENQGTDLSLFDIVTPQNGVYQDWLRFDYGANIIPGDFNGDGKTDFIRQEKGGWDDETSNSFNIYFSKGDGQFDIVTPNIYDYQNYLRFDPGVNIIPGDYNGDGKTDFIRQEKGGWDDDTIASFQIYISRGDGYFDIITPNNADYQNYLRFDPGVNIIPGDYNGDRKTDFIRQEKGGWDDDTIASFQIYISRGDGYFDIITPEGGVYQDWLRFDYGANIIPGDFNGDGKTDFIRQEKGGWDDETSNSFNIYFSKGDGKFDIITPNIQDYQTFLRFDPGANLIPGDYNGDGKTDFIRQEKGGWDDDTIASFQIYVSRGDGYFDIITPENGVYQDWLRFDYGANIISGDYNGDGYDDFIRQEKGGWDDDLTNNFNVYFSNPAKQQALKLLGSNDGVKNITFNSLRNQYYPELNNPTTLATLQQQISDQQTQSQQQIDQLKNSISQKQAEAAASISQADWYQEKSAFYWEQSRKQGPTWIEYRESRGRSGRSETVTITHVDHHWIIWDTYTKQATALREHAAQLLKGVETDTLNKDTTTTILDQWNKARAVANEAALSQSEFIHLLQQLEAERKLSEDKIAQISDWEKLLPILQTQLEIATQDATTATTNVQKETGEYQTSKDNYLTALNSVLEKRAELQTKTQLLQQDITAAKNWVTQQTTYLADELTQTQTLITQLQTQRDLIPPTSLDNGGDENLTKKAQLDQSIQLLTQKQTVLTSQQATLTQKQTLLSTQEQVLLTEYQLLDATLASPDKDTSTLEQQLTDTRKTLAEVQKLAEQAEASSQALTAVMDDLQASLLLQNDKYLAAIKDKQQGLKKLLEATELEKNYTLQATTKRQELNSFESQLLTILKQANDAGSKEAAQLLEVANANNMATAAELYYKDYRDLASDKGGGCSGGIARPEDLILADKYYAEMQQYRQLQQQAQQQASQFTALRQAAENQITLLEGQKALATEELAQLQQSIGNSQEAIEAHKQEIAVAEFRIDALSQLKDWTNQTLLQVLSVEKFNLAQAQLEQEIAEKRGQLIDDAVAAQLEKQRLDIQRDRQIAVTKLEQLNQLNTEEALQQAINNLRTDLGINPIANIITQANYKGQLAGILADLDTLKQKQPSLPAELESILTATRQDIHAALQGKEAATIQDNLLKTVDGLIDNNNKLNAEVTKLEQEEQQYLGILKQSETDLKGASKALYEEIQKTGVLTQEKELLSQQNLEILYKIGYAQGAVDLSDDLARQSQQLLSQIIEGRVKEREIRKKAFVNEVLGTATLVISLVSAVFTVGASLAVNIATAGLSGAAATAAAASATVLGVSVGTITSIATTLSLISSSLSAVQSAYNGDWAGAVFHAAMAFASYEISDINSELAKNPQVIETTKAIDVAKEAKDLSLVGELTQKLELLKYELSPNLLNLTRFQTVAQGAYSSYQYAKTGDTTLALLSGVQSLANAASLGIKDITNLNQASDIQKFFITAGQVSLVTAQGIKAIENGNWLDAANAIGKIAGQIDKNFALGLGEAGKKELIDLTGLKWEEIQDFGKLSSALYQTIDNKDWIKAIQTAGKAINLVDDSLLGVDLGTEAHKAIKDLTGFEWEEVETIIQSGVKLEIAVRERNLEAITQSVKSIVNVWVTDDKLKLEAQKVTGLSWEEIQRITQTGEAINKAIEKGDTAAWIKSSNELLGIWQGNQTLQNFLKTNLNLDWKDFQQVVKAGQSIAIATDKQSVEQWGQSLKEVLNIWYDDDTLKNKLTTVSGLSWEQIQKTEETISTLNKAYEQGNTLAWIEASNKILKLWETDQTLANKIKVNTGLDWQDFEKIVKAGQATAIAVDSEKLKDWGQAIRKVANIWADDATLKSKIEQATGLTWSQLNKLENTVQELDKATQNNNTQSWITASDNILTIWKTDPSFAKKLKEVTSLDFTDLEKIVKAGQASATAIDSQEIAKWGQAIRRVANIWVDDNTLKSTAEDLTGLSWEKLQKLDKTVQAINTAINKDTTQDWINASDAILKIWQDDPTLTQKLTTYTNLNWQDIENIVKAGQEIAKAVDQQTLAQWGNAIKSAVNIWVDNNTLTQAEKATGLTWSQLENLVLTNRLIQQAIDTNDLETWKKSTDEIINIWKEDKVLTQKLKEKAGIEWKDIEYIVKSGQAIATASQDTTLENLTAAIEQIVSIGDQDPQLKEKIRSIFELEWQKLEAISQKNQQIQADLAQQQQENWVTTNQKLINILEKNDALIQENLAPIIINPIPNQTATTNKLFTFTVAETTFTDIDKNDFLTYSATDVNGNSLPKWLSFDPKTRTFSGTSKDTTSSSVDIKLEVKDTKGLSSSNVFILTINAISNATIETFGNTKLVQDATNKLYTQIGNNNPIAIKIGATQITTNTYPGWQTLAAETVNGVNQVLWKYNDSNHLHLWSLD
ncbi:VCBS repeat-containing protein, partial [Microcystis aeruginosa LEGE 11464]|uniref:putative Ig domain-containing protein n=1 Tax=Microcystis aeruginosa TaxID=1126 RepID=UPI00187E2640